MAEQSAGWFLAVPAKTQSGARGTWHYFDEGQRESRCRRAVIYKTRQTVYPRFSSAMLMTAGPCGTCNKRRRKEEA